MMRCGSLLANTTAIRNLTNFISQDAATTTERIVWWFFRTGNRPSSGHIGLAECVGCDIYRNLQEPNFLWESLNVSKSEEIFFN